MSRFGRDLNQSGDGLPPRFQMLSCLARHRTRQFRLKFPLLLTINAWGDNLGFQLTEND